VNLFGLMETSGSAMQAERVRAEVVAANMANAETTRTASGAPYRRQHVVFAAEGAGTGFANAISAASGAQSSPSATLNALAAAAPPSGGTSATQTVATGVRIAGVVEDTSPPLKRYDPGNPDAGEDGYVSYPDINPLTEMADLMGATRAYGLNSSAVQAEKGMIASALEIAKS
jgi:flagellar basal-body rod protein FlgC